MTFDNFCKDSAGISCINLEALSCICEEENTIKKRILERYLLDFRRFDSESLYPWGDLTHLIESF